MWSLLIIVIVVGAIIYFMTKQEEKPALERFNKKEGTMTAKERMQEQITPIELDQ